MPTGANSPKSQTSTPASKPPPESAEDLAWAIFRDADRKLAEKLAGKAPTNTVAKKAAQARWG